MKFLTPKFLKALARPIYALASLVLACGGFLLALRLLG